MITGGLPEYMLLADGSVKQFPTASHIGEIRSLLHEWGGIEYYCRTVGTKEFTWVLVPPDNRDIQFDVVLPAVIKLAVMLE